MDALNNRYIYINNQTIICLFIIKKKADSSKTQVASYIYFEYKEKKYLRVNKANVWPL